MTKPTTLLSDRQTLLKKIKTPPPHKKKFEFLLPPHKRHIWFCRHLKASPKAKPKEPLLPTLYRLHSEFFKYDSLLCKNMNSLYSYIQQTKNELNCIH